MRKSIIVTLVSFITIFYIVFVTIKCNDFRTQLRQTTLKVGRCDDTVMGVLRLKDKTMFEFQKGCRCTLIYKGKPYLPIDIQPGTCKKIEIKKSPPKQKDSIEL